MNRRIGLVIAVMAIPATAALVGYAAAGSVWWVGPVDRIRILWPVTVATPVGLIIGMLRAFRAGNG